jgi:hypothetical protein
MLLYSGLAAFRSMRTACRPTCRFRRVAPDPREPDIRLEVFLTV